MNGYSPWTDEAWARLDERCRGMYIQRVAGRTLQEIGDQQGLTRERVRQLLLRAGTELTKTADTARPRWRRELAATSGEMAVPASAIETMIGAHEQVAVAVLARAAGFELVHAWGCVIVQDWWTMKPGAIDGILHEVADAAPMRQAELEVVTAVSMLPGDFPLKDLLGHSRSPLTRAADGSWLRRAARGRDAAYLWLAERGAPCRAEELICVMDGAKLNTIREALRRDERFAQIRPEGTWVLTEWAHPGVSGYRNAEEAMIAVLEEEGAMARDLLFARVIERYPVSTWRLQQCLTSDRIGITLEGLVDLIARGAEPIEEHEPSKPNSIAVDSARNVLGLRLTVNNDVLRGSGLFVNTWLTWQLGFAPGTHVQDIRRCR